MKEIDESGRIVKISVRNLVEFILKSGDIDSGSGGGWDTDAIQQGSRLHRKIQKQGGADYRAEVTLSITVPAPVKENPFQICVEGRADGIIEKDKESVIIDEIKAMYLDVESLREPIGVHRSQVMCYAYIYGSEHKQTDIKIRLTYCNIETEHIRYFEESFSMDSLKEWFDHLIEEYTKWAAWQQEWTRSRRESVQAAEFPFPYRPGQRELVSGVYKTILREKKLYIEAPTGVGKTISTVFPAVKAMGEGLGEKIFYLTAKTITRTVAEETFQLLKDQGMNLKFVTLTAKDRICVLEKPACNPRECQRAKGHYDRVNDAVYDLLTNEDGIHRDLILDYAKKHCVCPFEMCLDVTLWADAVICDYNYAFDPNVYLKRFFADEKRNNYIFLIDEAHNLVERAREMYSAVLIKEQLLEVKKIVKGRSRKLESRLSACNSDLLALKRQCDEFREVDQIEEVILRLLRLMAEYEEFLKEFPAFDGREAVLELYFTIRHFLNMYDRMNAKYVIYTDYTEKGEFRLKLQCMDPSDNLELCLKRGRSAVFFSATLLPIQYYKEQLAGGKEDYAVYAPSPFDKKKRLLLVGRDVSTQYRRRNKQEFEKITGYIADFTKARVGNYMVFFPSYQLMEQVLECMEAGEYEKDFAGMEMIIQKTNMGERDREEFLEFFRKEPAVTHIGLCAMGGIFGEGIDLKEDRLIGAVIVGTGLPMVCNERELFRRYYEEMNGEGFAYAYLYNGMNKVLQSAGRVIRMAEDKGAILLLDERFERSEYQELFPEEWFPHLSVTRKSMEEPLGQFWEERT